MSIVYKHPWNPDIIMSNITFAVIYNQLWIVYKQNSPNIIVLPDAEMHISTPDDNTMTSNSLNSSQMNTQEQNNTLTQASSIQAKVKRRVCMCPFSKDGKKCRFEKLRNNSSLANHNCQQLSHKSLFLEPFSPNPMMSLSITGSNLSFSSPRQLANNLILTFLASTPLSFMHAGSQAFNDMVIALISIGQQHPSASLADIVPHFERHNIPNLLSMQAQQRYLKLLTLLQGTFISLGCDAGEINNVHCASLFIQTYARKRKPIFFEICPGTWNKLDYTKLFIEFLSQMKEWFIHVGSICTDGLAAQVSAVHSLFTGEDLETKSIVKEYYTIPFHVYCCNHKINLIVSSLANLPHLQKIISTLQTFCHTAHKKNNRAILNKACPAFIPTR